METKSAIISHILFQACGLVKNPVLMTQVITNHDKAPIIRLVFNLGLKDTHMPERLVTILY